MKGKAAGVLFVAMYLGLGGLWLLAAGPVIAQAPGEQGFRDPKSGKIWTPENVGEDGKPVAPEDRAFDPSGQAVVSSSSVERNVRTESIGRVPVSAGPTVPLVDANDIKLRVRAGGYWTLDLHIANNSAVTQSPVVRCEFHNGGRTVHTTTANLLPVASGEQVAISLRGPRAQTFVDTAQCFVERP